MDASPGPLTPQVGGAEHGRGEQQLRLGVDRDPELLLRPGPPAVVRTKPRFDMGKRDLPSRGGKRRPERGGRVALDDQKFDLGQQRQDCLGHGAGMDMRVAAAGTIEPYRRIAVEPEVGRIERVLPGQDQRRRNCARAQLIGNGGELDGFGAGADCKRDLSGQSFP